MKPDSVVEALGAAKFESYAMANMDFPSVPADCQLQWYKFLNGVSITRPSPGAFFWLKQGYISCTVGKAETSVMSCMTLTLNTNGTVTKSQGQDVHSVLQ
jgi:hypothetical protein